MSSPTIKYENDHPLVAKLRDMLNLKTRVMITDGRVFTGIFMCVDKDKNIILSGAEEFRE
ncbi:hypothetical protein HDU76_003742, partial [Blyttiomyces sp. JEL0837]